MKRGLFVLAVAMFVAFWGAASWIGGWIYACEPPTCSLWPEGPMLIAAVGSLIVVAAVAVWIRRARSSGGA